MFMWCSPKLNVASLSMKLTALGRGVHHITTSIPFNRRNSLAGMILGGWAELTPIFREVGIDPFLGVGRL
ncbi:hypothetical protein VO70_18295 [Aeromonas salmonicida]|nr:hypothetical protein VO70_18295 [Aeromonas salmonicida]